MNQRYAACSQRGNAGAIRLIDRAGGLRLALCQRRTHTNRFERSAVDVDLNHAEVAAGQLQHAALLLAAICRRENWPLVFNGVDVSGPRTVVARLLRCES